MRCYRSRFRKTKALAVPDSAGALILSARKEGFMSTTQSHVGCRILVEAEEFEDFGGWTLDSQFGLRAPILIADETLEHEGSRDGKKDDARAVEFNEAYRRRKYVATVVSDGMGLGRLSCDVGEGVEGTGRTLAKARADWRQKALLNQ